MYLEFDFSASAIKKVAADYIFQSKNYSLLMDGICWRKGSLSCLSLPELFRLIIGKKSNTGNLLEGNFLIILIDQNSKRICCMTDRTGSIPLFYSLNGDCLTCSTDIKKLPAASARISRRQVLYYYKKGYTSAPHTIFGNIKKMGADSALYISRGEIKQSPAAAIAETCSLENCIVDTKKNIENYCSKTQPAILVTGGMDSSLLVHLAKALKPVLYFGAVISSFNRKYNYHSIKKGLLLAKRMSLKYKVISIKYKDYIKNYLKVIKIMDEPLYDPDLPAVLTLFQNIAAPGKKHCCIISGMGVNELFNLPAHLIRKYSGEKIAPEINIHKKIGRHCGMDFYAPFLNRSFFSYVLNTPLKERKNKASLKKIIQDLKILPPEYINQPSLHSDIPDKFINDACYLYSQKIEKRTKTNNRFKDTLLKLWIQEFSPEK